MKKTSSNRSVRIRKALKLGEPALIEGACNSPIYKMLITEFGKALLWIMLRLVRVNSAMQAYMLTATKNGNHGVLVCGLFLTLACSTMMIAYNSHYVWTVWDALSSFSMPEPPHWQGMKWYEVFYDVAIDNIISLPVLCFNALFFGSSLFHTLKNWSGFGTNQLTKRGTSHFYKLLDRCFAKWLTIGEFFINFLETALILGLGIAFIHYAWDMHFGWLLVSISVNELMTLLRDKTAQLTAEPLLEL